MCHLLSLAKRDEVWLGFVLGGKTYRVTLKTGGLCSVKVTLMKGVIYIENPDITVEIQ